ncbi:dna polymerase [Stemphylium lycopersici]|nr:dna polymerase [Stemphylium lycopersici]
MSDSELSAKEAYFQEQAILDHSDDEEEAPNESVRNLERALEESKAMPPPSLPKQASSFLGLTPRERRAEFEAHTKKQRASERQSSRKLTRSPTAPGSGLTSSFPVTRSRTNVVANSDSGKRRLRDTSSLHKTLDKEPIPFYKQMGVVPRELKSGKNVKLANDIKLLPEQKQLLKGKIVYFFPNDDISSARRQRIHKVIQLGAAWVNRWVDNITHVILDDDTYTYARLMRHLNQPIPHRVVLVKYQPYVPSCIESGMLLDPNKPYFIVKGANRKNTASETPDLSHTSIPSQSSMKIKVSKRLYAARGSENTDSHSTEESVPSTHPITDGVPSSPFGEIVEDSFMAPSPGATKASEPEAVGRFGDALSQAIKETKALLHLPLDEDEEAESPTASGVDDMEGSGTDEDPSTSPRLPKNINFVSKASALRAKKPLNTATFQCIDPGANGYTSQNPNARTIEILDEMCKHYDKMHDQWRTLSYRKCITTLKKQTVKVTTAKQAEKLPFIGSRLAAKIEEIVLTDHLRRLDSTRNDPLNMALHLFLGVYGAGLVQANKWIQAGHRTLEDLKTKAKLTESQKVGIEHYDDFNSRIPRAEVEAHGAVVIAALKKIDPKFNATIMGSYRRGAKDSGDIDMILTRPNTSLAAMRATILDVLVPHLYSTSFLKASLATSRSNDPSGSKWHGVSCLPGSTVRRRIDFLLVPEDEMGAALLYFTGNDIFNRSMRLLARKKGMRLNQRGLYKDVQRGTRGERLNDGVLVEGRSEKRIFEVLGVPWREPDERVC